MTPVNGSAAAGNHPCFSWEAARRFGRIHLPVAAGCNIRCVYCRRDHDCPHDNRPGVTSEVLGPEAALARLDAALAAMPHIRVAGIAGPGDAFCAPETTLRTFELIRRKHSKIALCVSSNGLNVKDYIPFLFDLGVGFVTVTVNSIDPAIGAVLYKMVTMDGRTADGSAGAAYLIERQLEAVSALKSAGITVKVNAVVIPGVNDHHIPLLAKKMNRLEVDLMNLIPLIPLKGTDMEGVAPPSPAALKRLRHKAGQWVPQMRHCNRCRSDAAGLLNQDPVAGKKKANVTCPSHWPLNSDGVSDGT